jgi:hypothetical protein
VGGRRGGEVAAGRGGGGGGGVGGSPSKNKSRRIGKGGGAGEGGWWPAAVGRSAKNTGVAEVDGGRRRRPSIARERVKDAGQRGTHAGFIAGEGVLVLTQNRAPSLDSQVLTQKYCVLMI